MEDRLDFFIEQLEMKAHQGYSLYDAITYARKALQLKDETDIKINDEVYNDVISDRIYGND